MVKVVPHLLPFLVFFVDAFSYTAVLNDGVLVFFQFYLRFNVSDLLCQNHALIVTLMNLM